MECKLLFLLVHICFFLSKITIGTYINSLWLDYLYVYQNQKFTYLYNSVTSCDNLLVTNTFNVISTQPETLQTPSTSLEQCRIHDTTQELGLSSNSRPSSLQKTGDVLMYLTEELGLLWNVYKEFQSTSRTSPYILGLRVNISSKSIFSAAEQRLSFYTVIIHMRIKLIYNNTI